MIDEKKISKAAKEHAVDTWNHEEEQFSCMDGFKAGAKWVLQEFKKSLWHDASEEPKRYDDYLVKTKQVCVDACFFDADGWKEPKIGGGDVAMWLDLKDILPKEGGE